MITQAERKRIVALHQKKHREESGRFLVQTRKIVAELLGSRLRVDALYATAEAAAFIGEAAAKRRVTVTVLPDFELGRIGTLENGNELVAVARSPEPPDFRAPGQAELMLALDGIHDPRNMGSLIRIADWFGIHRVLCSPDCIEVYNPKVVQSTMGSLFRVEVRYAALEEELARCAADGAALYLADMDGASVFDVPLSRPAILVLGSESHGLSPALRSFPATTISIPRVGRAESLNVAMAASALCAEFTRRALSDPRIRA